MNRHVAELRKFADFIDRIGSGDYVEGEGDTLRAAASEIERLERNVARLEGEVAALVHPADIRRHRNRGSDF